MRAFLQMKRQWIVTRSRFILRIQAWASRRRSFGGGILRQAATGRDPRSVHQAAWSNQLPCLGVWCTVNGPTAARRSSLPTAPQNLPRGHGARRTYISIQYGRLLMHTDHGHPPYTLCIPKRRSQHCVRGLASDESRTVHVCGRCQPSAFTHAIWQIGKRYQQGGLKRALFDASRRGKVQARDQQSSSGLSPWSSRRPRGGRAGRCGC
jgi:hypothetical protein